ncbi:MAG: hypothetical protein GY795_38290 [Desulfobacterales bacterium]|nr:hypothetical protein [Desulfobacterales bacterium]
MTNNRGQMGKFLEKIIKPGMIGIVAIIVVISLGFNAMAVPTCVMEAVNDIYTTPKNTSLHINADSGVLANDEICGQQVIVHWIGKVPDPDPLHGSVTLQTDGSFIYEPDADYSGTDYFHYTIAADPAICENDCLDYDFLVAVVTIIVDDPSDLIAHYKMDNDWLDSSGNDNHAVSNGAAFTESAVVGTHAGSFGGSSNLNLGVMGDTAQSSFSFWFKPGQNISGFLNSAQALLAKDGNNEHAFRIVINTDGRLGAGMHGVGIGSGDWVWTTQNVWYDNQWYHVAVTQEAGDFRLYVDGVLAGQNTGAAQMQSANYNLYVGTNWYANGNYFDGLIDDLMIYSRILTPEEIQNYCQ